jgi:peptide/nickel transport system permease protein
MTLRYLAKRLGHILITLLLVAVAVFVITQVLPGNAAVMILGEFATPEALKAVELQLGLDRPVHAQFFSWLGRIVLGDWGTSMRMYQPILPAVAIAFGRSMLLALLTLVTVTLIAIPLGVLAAVRRGGAIDLGLSFVSYMGVSLPEFVTATLLVVLLARPELGWFPTGGYVPLTENFWSGLRHLILPVGVLSFILVAHISRQTRSEMVDVLQTEYVRTAVLKGLPRHIVILKHALRNALLPTITVIALDVGYLVGGILVVEQIFAFPGLGRLMIFAIQNRDLPLIQGAALFIAATYAFANLAADLFYALLDRRVQYA